MYVYIFQQYNTYKNKPCYRCIPHIRRNCTCMNLLFCIINKIGITTVYRKLIFTRYTILCSLPVWAISVRECARVVINIIPTLILSLRNEIIWNEIYEDKQDTVIELTENTSGIRFCLQNTPFKEPLVLWQS